MKDFLRGTLGMLLQVVLNIAGLLLVGIGCVSCMFGEASGPGVVCAILGVLCFCAAFGIKYWLGHVARLR